MIAVSDAWLAEEANPNRQPVYFATFLPHYFITGVAAGSGTLVNMTFVAPGRLQVNDGAGLASWTSPGLAALVANYPSITPSWNLSSPGFDCTVQYRTAVTAAGLAAAAWQTLTNGEAVSLYRYYQWRISFVAIRAWAYDTVEDAEASEVSAWALDAPDPSDPYESFADDTAFSSTVAYIEDVIFAGIFEVDSADVKDWGSITEECSPNLGDLVAGDYTIVLANRDFKYSCTHPNFVFAAEPHNEKKHLKIEMAYRLPDGTYTERITRYEGIVQDFGPAPGGVSDKKTGKLVEHTATITTRNFISDLQDLKVGEPADDGTPQPLVMGEIFRQLDQVADETLGDPDAAVDFESGDTTGLAGVDSSGGGVVAVATADPINGDYYLHTEVAAAAAEAKGRLDLAVAGVEVLFTKQIRFNSVPDAPVDKNMHFLGLYDNTGAEIIKLFVGSDYRVFVLVGGTYKETDWYVNRDVGVVKTASIAVSGYEYGTLKVWLNGQEVLTWDDDWRSLSLKGGFFGPHNGDAAEAWSLDWDDPKIYPNWWPQLFRARGGPYESIGTVYVEGAIRVGAEPLSANQARRNLRFGAAGVQSTLVGGITQTTGVEKFPEYGAVAFTDYSNKVSGTVAAYLRKDSTTHWLPAVRRVLAVHGYDQYLDEAAAAAAQAATADDSAGYYFENITAGDAISAMAKTCLFSFFQTSNLLKISAYTGAAPTTYDLELTLADLQSWSPVRQEREIKNKIFAKYSRYAQNNRLSKIAKNEESIKFLGVRDSEIDLSWAGGCIGSDNGPMVQRKADALLCRLLGGQLSIDPAESTLRLARLQPGDLVRLNVPEIGDPLIMEVTKNEIELMIPKGARLALNKFLGEAV